MSQKERDRDGISGLVYTRVLEMRMDDENAASDFL